MTQALLEEACRAVYRETKSFYSDVAEACGGLGFKILYSPPVYKPPIMFVGYQPGGDRESYEREILQGAHDRWPRVCQYASEDWRISKRLRTIFDEAFLEKCVGLNALFIRSPSDKKYRNIVDRATRRKIAEFCLPRVERLIAAVRPQRIVAIGFKTLKLFGGGEPDLRNDKDRILTRVGRIAGQPAIATLHLSGSRISQIDRDRIRDRILAASISS